MDHSPKQRISLASSFDFLYGVQVFQRWKILMMQEMRCMAQ
jgi:hypothetical protein